MQEATTHEVIYQSIIAFFVLFVLARILGKRQIAQLTFFDYVTGLTLGNIAGAWSLDQVKNLHAIIALSIWTLLTIALALIQIKFYKSRSILDGKPRELIQAGKLLEKNLKKARLSTEELLLMLRQKNAFKVADVEYAVFEKQWEAECFEEVRRFASHSERYLYPSGGRRGTSRPHHRRECHGEIITLSWLFP